VKSLNKDDKKDQSKKEKKKSLGKEDKKDSSKKEKKKSPKKSSPEKNKESVLFRTVIQTKMLLLPLSRKRVPLLKRGRIQMMMASHRATCLLIR